jgi:signal transduction histidine kinase
MIGVGVAFVIGMFSSRKIAVPLYKVEKWAYRLRNGKLNSELAFREEDRLEDLTSQCNGVTEFFRKTFLEIQELTSSIEQNPENTALVKYRIAAIKRVLEKVEM